MRFLRLLDNEKKKNKVKCNASIHPKLYQLHFSITKHNLRLNNRLIFEYINVKPMRI